MKRKKEKKTVVDDDPGYKQLGVVSVKIKILGTFLGEGRLKQDSDLLWGSSRHGAASGAHKPSQHCQSRLGVESHRDMIPLDRGCFCTSTE